MINRKSNGLLILLLAGVLSLSACGDNTSTFAPVATTAAATTAAVAAGSVTTAAAAGAAPAPTVPLPTLSDSKAEAGRLVVAKTCSGCHLGQGTQAGRAPVLATSQNANNPDFVRKQVRQGGTRMPAFDQTKVSDAELDSIILYLQAIHK